jgi:Flp pilus assembly protein TadG
MRGVRGLRVATLTGCLARDQAGAVSAITGLLIVSLVLSAGLAIDTSRLFLVRAHLGEAVDAAALAAGQAVDSESVRTDAERIFRLNYPGAYLGATVGDLQVNYDEDNGRVEIVAATSVPTAFMRLANVDELAIQTRAVVVREQTGLELALVLDVTGSMCNPCTKRDALKAAANDLLDIIYGPNDVGEDLYVAVVPFSERVRIGNSTRTKAWMSSVPSSWNGCTDQRSGSYAFDDTPATTTSTKFPAIQTMYYKDKQGRTQDYTPYCPVSADTVLPLTASKATVKSKINGLQTDGYTRIDIAAGWGWRTLSERWQGRWGTAGLPLDDEWDTAKAIVIMSDGQNDIPDVLPDPAERAMKAQADADLASTCEAMRDAGYEVFTVAFQAPADGESALRACAASSDKYFATATPADLRRAFRQIAGRLSALRLAE